MSNTLVVLIIRARKGFPKLRGADKKCKGGIISSRDDNVNPLCLYYTVHQEITFVGKVFTFLFL
jgi:hypothetical protein